MEKKKNLMAITAKLPKGSENPPVLFEICNKYVVSINCMENLFFL